MTGARTSLAAGFVLTARTELTELILVLDERHLRAVLADYGAHYVRHEAPLTMWR